MAADLRGKRLESEQPRRPEPVSPFPSRDRRNPSTEGSVYTRVSWVPLLTVPTKSSFINTYLLIFAFPAAVVTV